jgi:nucleoside-diphosphate-sugar epimerase
MPSERGYTFITGATGLIGHYLLAALVARGRRCAVLLRPPIEGSVDRLSALLWALGCDAGSLMRARQLVAVEGDLAGAIPECGGLDVQRVIHAAAATNFRTDPQGEPERTNIRGTARLLEWAKRREVREFHLISSAYVCGRSGRPAEEAVSAEAPAFHNDYEQTKWHAEQRCAAWAQQRGRTLTIYRPSVVVGEYATGRSTKFAGAYLSARATELLDRMFRDADGAARHTIPLRLKGRRDGCQNIVPVDYVATMIATILERPADHGRVYHLTHPHPPTNETIKRAYELYFDIGGGRFVAPDVFDRDALNEYEQRFYDVSRSIEHYFIDTPTFLRANTERIEQAVGQACPVFDVEAIQRLVSYAVRANWGRPRTSTRAGVPSCASYFEEFLPEHVVRSRIARMTGLSAVVRFVIEDEENGEWVCRFERGRLAGVERGRNGIQEDFGYRATREVFWESVSGRTHPDELFLTGRAELFGEIERALKMAVVLHEFTREFPCDPVSAAPAEGGRV